MSVENKKPMIKDNSFVLEVFIFTSHFLPLLTTNHIQKQKQVLLSRNYRSTLQEYITGVTSCAINMNIYICEVMKSGRSLMEIRNNVGPRIKPWGTQIVM